MIMRDARTISMVGLALTVPALLFVGPDPAEGCGGFFCQLVPIDQAGEQIIFRQDGDMITAVVLIQYEGQAEDFSWVVPVPGIPELSVGSTAAMNQLEVATRPQFFLDIQGAPCPQIEPLAVPSFGAAPSESADNGGGGVEVLAREAVGPFDAQVVASEDPEAMATWLEENDYDLTDRGAELIGPYVEEGMNFVALRLQQNQDVGDIQPLIMRYKSANPMIPIRLTAVAAMPDMGVVVWLLGNARAVPTNYLHVTPNYTRLNWYTGTFAAYASYQGLITAAMNEAGGQGFATDYAGRDQGFLDQLPSVASYEAELARLNAIDNDAFFVAELAFNFVYPTAKTLEILRRQLPLPEGEDEFVYQIPELLGDLFSSDALAAARPAIVEEIQMGLIDPLEETLAVFDGGPYMTRLYTTLSPEEMTLDPEFAFNPDLPDQAMTREATMVIDCVFGSTNWTLTLGPGTGRDGELVIEGTGLPPSFVAPVIDQVAVWQTAETAAVGQPVIKNQNAFAVAMVLGEESGGPAGCGPGSVFCGSGAFGALLFSSLTLRLVRHRRRVR
jgi:hypothetical protein